MVINTNDKFINDTLLEPAEHLTNDDEKNASILIHNEMLNLLNTDCYKHWNPEYAKITKIRPSKPIADALTDSEYELMASAKQLINDEMNTILSENGGAINLEQFTSDWNNIHRNDFKPGMGKHYIKHDELLSLKSEFQSIKTNIIKDSKIAMSLEHDIASNQSGMHLRVQQAADFIDMNYSKYCDLRTEINTLLLVQKQEERSMNNRLITIKNELQSLQNREKELQIHYGKLVGL